MASQYQLPSDGHDGKAYSGVIKSDGTWVPCEAGNKDWVAYQEWAADPKNVPDPFRSPADGGVALKLKEGQVATGAMLDSMPPEQPAPTPPPAPAPEPPKEPAPTTRTSSRS